MPSTWPDGKGVIARRGADSPAQPSPACPASSFMAAVWALVVVPPLGGPGRWWRRGFRPPDTAVWCSSMQSSSDECRTRNAWLAMDRLVMVLLLWSRSGHRDGTTPDLGDGRPCSMAPSVTAPGVGGVVRDADPGPS